MSTTKLQDPPIQPPSVGEGERLVHENLLQEWRYMLMNDLRTMKAEIDDLEDRVSVLENPPP